MVVLGVDPGFVRAGYAVIKKQDRATVLLDYGYLRMKSSQTIMERTGIFYQFFQQKIRDCSVTHLALETPFLGKNAQNFLKLGYLRGLLYLLADQNTLVLSEFSPTQVKLSLTGYGGASKEQVSRVVHQLCAGALTVEYYDVSDALAVTFCGLWQNQSQLYYLGKSK